VEIAIGFITIIVVNLVVVSTIHTITIIIGALDIVVAIVVSAIISNFTIRYCCCIAAPIR